MFFCSICDNFPISKVEMIVVFFLGCGADFPQKLSAALWWKPSSLKSQKHRQLLYSQKLHDSSNPEQAPLPPFQKSGSTARMRGAFDQQDKSALC